MWVYRIPTAWCDADFRGLEMYGAAGTEFVFEGNMVRFGSFKTSPNRVPPHRRTDHTVRNLCVFGIAPGGRYNSANVFPNIYPRRIVTASVLLVTLGMAMCPPDRLPVRVRVEFKTCHECITLLIHYPSCYKYLFHRNRYVWNMCLMIICN